MNRKTGREHHGLIALAPPAAFDRISRSTRSWRTSRRSRTSSSRSVVARPAGTASRRPSCLSACHHPRADRLRGRLELLAQARRQTSSAHQIDHLATKLRGIRGMGLGHRKTPPAKTSGCPPKRVNSNASPNPSSCYTTLLSLAGSRVAPEVGILRGSLPSTDVAASTCWRIRRSRHCTERIWREPETPASTGRMKRRANVRATRPMRHA